jgi:hypothetical protein
MMTDACQYSCQYYGDCTGRGTLSRPKPGDCCAFFSDGSIKRLGHASGQVTDRHSVRFS